MTDSIDLDERLAACFEAFDTLPVDAPPPPGRSRPSRDGVVALAACLVGLIAVGVVGLVVAGRSGSTDGALDGDRSGPTDAVTDPATPAPPTPGSSVLGTETSDESIAPDGPTSSSVESIPPGDVVWCRGLVGREADGARIYDDCGPETEYGIVDFVCRGFVGTDDEGWDGFAECETVATDSAVPGIDSLPTPIPPPLDVAPPFATTGYVIRTGDIPIDVAAAHCMSLEQLSALNSETEGYTAFVVGLEIEVRDRTPDEGCTNPRPITYVIQGGDWPLRIADLFCIEVDELVAANGWTSENEFPFPGNEIRIPAGSCTDP